MFPLTNKEPYIKYSGQRTTLGDMFAQAGSDISELEQEVDELKEALSNEVITRSTLGAHNLFNISLEDIKNTNGTGTWSGNVYTLNETTFTVQSDMSIDVTNAPSATTTFYLINFASGAQGFNKSKWFLDLCRSGSFKLSSGSALKSINIDYYNGGTYISNQNGIEINVNVPQNADRCQVFFRISTTDPSSGISLKPMICLATDSDPTYQPYAMTNRELTDAKIDASQIAPIENGTTASTNYSQGAYFIHNGKFCKAKTSISSGATFTKGTNYEETTVAAELIALA